MTEYTYDIVVVGAGSNSLTTAAYMAKAGKSVLVLEKNKQCGGGAVSVEVAPGFIHDPHATGYLGCYNSPTLTADELGLYSKSGLKFGKWDAAFTTLFDDGSTLATFRDIDRTCESIAKFSSRDAEAYRKFATRCTTLVKLLSMGTSNPPLPTSGFFGLLQQSHQGRELGNAFFASAWNIITHYFESAELQAHYFKWVAEAMEHPETKGTGIAMYQLLGQVHTTDSVFPVGGGQQLSNALVDAIQRFGGTVRTEAEVVKLKVESGVAKGVFLSDGEYIAAQEAVVACIHPWKLGEAIPDMSDELKEEMSWVRLSNHGACNQQISLNTEPEWKTDDSKTCLETMCLELMKRKDSLEMRRSMDGFRFGELPAKEQISPLVMRASVFDKSRVPQDDYCAMYVYQFAPITDALGDPVQWDDIKIQYAEAIWDVVKQYSTNLNDSNILGRLVESPQDHYRHSSSMMHGDIFGIGLPGQVMGLRPNPATSDFTIPGIDNIYLVGPFMHPGGTVTLGGRTTAVKMYMNMGLDLATGFEGY
ncbi:MAG: NAD(P)/FAD-dependent oxidoreductase [Halieaceae bacterium]|nr:NAD(P)/FAD-dependent oxidoreductase [Halieaceae bacterium]